MVKTGSDPLDWKNMTALPVTLCQKKHRTEVTERFFSRDQSWVCLYKTYRAHFRARSTFPVKFGKLHYLLNLCGLRDPCAMPFLPARCYRLDRPKQVSPSKGPPHRPENPKDHDYASAPRSGRRACGRRWCFDGRCRWIWHGCLARSYR